MYYLLEARKWFSKACQATPMPVVCHIRFICPKAMQLRMEGALQPSWYPRMSCSTNGCQQTVAVCGGERAYFIETIMQMQHSTQYTTTSHA